MDKLYYTDSYTTEFEAHILERRNLDGRVALILDRTYFYPTSGGQPFDTGWINDVPVTDVLDDEGVVLHVLAQDVPATHVRAKIDWTRRFDHMQQHTGQHILSAAFEAVLSAPTVSFHLGDEACTIDLGITSLDAEGAAQVERMANQVVMENHPICADFVEPDELARLPLRKPPPETEHIRIVSIGGLDYSPCGGTHCRATGEVGPIKITKCERHKQGVRIEFLCGWRAMDDYAWKHDAITRLANDLTVNEREVAESVERMSEEIKIARRGLVALESELLDYEAQTLLAQAPAWGDTGVVCHSFEDRDPEQVRRLGLRIAELGGVALLGVQTRPGRVFLARGPNAPGNMRDLLAHACKTVGGGGGGQPHAAQGGGMPPERVPDALTIAFDELRATLEAGLAGGKEG